MIAVLDFCTSISVVFYHVNGELFKFSFDGIVHFAALLDISLDTFVPGGCGSQLDGRIY